MERDYLGEEEVFDGVESLYYMTFCNVINRQE